DRPSRSHAALYSCCGPPVGDRESVALSRSAVSAVTPRIIAAAPQPSNRFAHRARLAPLTWDLVASAHRSSQCRATPAQAPHGRRQPILWVGVDVGGTCTDVVVYDEAAKTLRVGKSPTDPVDPTRGLLHAFEKLDVLLPQTERLVHGTTIGTNAVLEKKGADVWVITTRGFGDTLDIARTNRMVLYDIRALKPASLVPRQRVLEVDERMAFDGSALRPLDASAVSAAAARIRASNSGGVGAAVICFLHSYANPSHERAAAALAREQLPGWFVCTSQEVLPEWREYERFSTAVLNAYIGPLVVRYLTSFAATLLARCHSCSAF